jgi:hypothetical protein
MMVEGKKEKISQGNSRSRIALESRAIGSTQSTGKSSALSS